MARLVLIENNYSDIRHLKQHPDESCLKRVCAYIRSHEVEAYGYGCIADYAYEQMLAVKLAYGKVQCRQLRHYVFSVEAWELDVINGYEGLLGVGQLAGDTLQEYQLLYALHVNTKRPHIHMVVNTTSCLTGLQFKDDKTALFRIREAIIQQYPKLHVDVCWSDPCSNINHWDEDAKDDFLNID